VDVEIGELALASVAEVGELALASVAAILEYALFQNLSNFHRPYVGFGDYARLNRRGWYD